MICLRDGVGDVVKLLDFGLVLSRANVGHSGPAAEHAEIAGTPAYMSPEQAEGRTDLDARSDIYAPGALAYFTLTGQPPFSARPAISLLAAHRYEWPEPPTKLRPDIPAALEAITLRCLAKDPEQRDQSAEELDAVLAACELSGDWSASQATAWWRSHPASDSIAEDVASRCGRGMTTH